MSEPVSPDIQTALLASAALASQLAESASPSPEPTKRTYSRAVAHFSYTLITKTEDGQEWKLSGYTEDVSVGGVSITSPANIAMNSPLAIRIEMVCNGKLTPLVATGKVVHRSFSGKLGGFRYGVQFVKIADELKEAISLYVKAHSW